MKINPLIVGVAISFVFTVVYDLNKDMILNKAKSLKASIQSSKGVPE